MIIQELRLEPFAGILNLNAEFQRGLNVVLGPNEAGKSTLVNALKMALFVPTQYGKGTSEKDISKFMPIAGSDTIRVQLTFSLNGDIYRVSKSWGGKRESTLLLPDGLALADPKSVQERLQELLVLKEGTYHSVLFSYQSALGSTLDGFRTDPGPMHDLTSLLRKGFFETDGVSIETLEQKIEKTYKEYFSHWDRDLKRPENNRGIENPYKKEVGKILEAFYRKGELYRDLNRAIQYERDMDRINQEIESLSREISSLSEFVKNNREAAEDARKRAILEAEVRGFEKDQEQLREVVTNWPVIEQELKTSQGNLGDYKKRVEQLTEELGQAQTYESNRRKLEKWGRVEKKNKEFQDALGMLKGMKPISEEDYQKMEGLNTEVNRLKTGMKAGKIALTMTATRPMELKVKRDFEENIFRSLDVGQPLEFSAGGQIRLEHADWTMKVKSGEVDFDKLSAYFDQATQDYQKLLAELGVADFDEGKTVFESCRKQNQAVETLRKQLEEALEGELYEELERAAKLMSQVPAGRPVLDIAKEAGEIKAKVGETERDIASKTERLKEYESKYESKDRLLDLLVEKRGELKSRKEALGRLKPLPDGVANSEVLVSEYEKKQEALNKKNKDLADRQIARAGLEGNGPEETKEEIEIKYKEAENNFKQVVSEGEAVAEILKTFQEVKKSMDEQTLDPWIDELQKVVVPLTLNRYAKLHLEKNSPDGAERSDGLEIPFHALSMGTKVGLGLALRLSMASYFLKDLEGFLILDDPMVDMDPERQRAAADVVRGFSKNKQVILFTCHPHHAEMIGGNLIRLD